MYISVSIKHLLIESTKISIGIFDRGVWFRLGRWQNAGYYITWSIYNMISENIDDVLVWQIGKGIRFRIACFYLQQVYKEK